MEKRNENLRFENTYMELMVKNIHTHVKFTIKKQTEQGGL